MRHFCQYAYLLYPPCVTFVKTRTYFIRHASLLSRRVLTLSAMPHFCQDAYLHYPPCVTVVKTRTYFIRHASLLSRHVLTLSAIRHCCQDAYLLYPPCVTLSRRVLTLSDLRHSCQDAYLFYLLCAIFDEAPTYFIPYLLHFSLCEHTLTRRFRHLFALDVMLLSKESGMHSNHSKKYNFWMCFKTRNIFCIKTLCIQIHICKNLI